MANRGDVIRAIERDLDDRELVWFGTRGDDVAGVADISNLASAFSIIAPYRSQVSVAGYALESFSGLRVDLDAHDIDEDPFVEPIMALRERLLTALTSASAVFTYRPSTLLSAVCFTRADRTRYLGMFKDHQSLFEHKPWVETAVAGLGIDRVPWKYVADTERSRAVPMLRRGPLMLRRSRTSGGTGLVRIDQAEDLTDHWPGQDEAFVSVAPYIANAVPINVGAVVWDKDQVTVDYPSVQLIGISELTNRPFGYCGNDFAAAKGFDAGLLAAIESSTIRIGRWMATLGYRGAFGVDYLDDHGRLLFMEVNPRFQGSTHASSRLARWSGESCTMTDHIAALLHHGPGSRRPIEERVLTAPDLSHVVLHRTRNVGPLPDAMRIAKAMSNIRGFVHADLLHSPAIECEMGAALGRFTFQRSVTTTGFDMIEDIGRAVSAARQGAITVEGVPA